MKMIERDGEQTEKERARGIKIEREREQIENDVKEKR